MMQRYALTISLALALPGAAWAVGTVRPPAGAAARGQSPVVVLAARPYSPLQIFAGYNSAEIGRLSNEFQPFRDQGRTGVVMALYHMVRDHTLLRDAANNTLARRGQEPMPIPAGQVSLTADTPGAIIRDEVARREQALAGLQRLLATNVPAADRNIYQKAVSDLRQHLRWLRQVERGERLRVGPFGPTEPLSLIARNANTWQQQRVAGYRQRSSR